MSLQARMRDILRQEAAAISAVEVTDNWERALKSIIACRGKIVTTGMGKAGMIARKFAAVLCSTGTPAGFIEAGEAAHGDLGFIAPGDCLIAFSTSGMTREVVELIQLGRHLGLETVIGVTSHPDSELRDLSNIVIDMGLIEEPCPLGMTPTASMAVMAAIGDALALVVMEEKQITRHDYGLRHHGGYLGRKARVDNE